MPNPFFTVITVTYNSSQFVRDAIESVLASTFTDFELIIGDDCSTDNTWEIINEYDDSRIVKYRNEINLREYPNRNKALSMARGEWVIFIDGDDLMYPHALSFVNEMIQKDNSVGMLLMRWYRNNVFYPIIISPRDFYLEKYFGEGFLGTAFTNVVFNKSCVIRNGGIPTDFKFGDDYLRMKIALSNNMMVVSDQLTFWRETPNQASQINRHLLPVVFEKWDTEFYFLNEALSLKIINQLEFSQAQWNLSKSILRMIIIQTLKMNFSKSMKILLKYVSLLKLFHKRNQLTLPLSEFTPSNLLTLEKSKSRLND